jgi:hypothetical protein
MVNEELFTSIEPLWKSETAYLIGGGPSLKGIDWNQLRGKRTIAINRAFQVLPWADVLYWTDAQFYKWYKREIDAFQGMKVTCRPVDILKKDIKLLKGIRDFGLDLRPQYICDGNNSGYGALNLAVKLGAARIYLLGYDLHSQPGQTHWHNGYIRSHNHTIYKKLMKYFESSVPILGKLNIEVWNANPGSHLQCFRKCTLADALKDSPAEIRMCINE